MKQGNFDVLNALAKELGIKKTNENNGGVNIYNPKHFQGLDNNQIRSKRKKLRDTFVIPMLQQICAIKDKKEFSTKKEKFIAMYKDIYILDNFDFSVFGMLRGNNAEIAEKAKKVWESYNK